MTKMKKITASGVLIAVLSAAIIGSVGFVAFKMLSVDRDLLGSTEDRVNDNYGEQYRNNINVMLQRPDDWYQIASESFLTHSDFAGIDGSTATVPITAELARQFLNAPDGEEMNAYVSHNKTDRAYENLILGDTNRLFDRNSDTEYEKQVRLVFATPPSEDEYALAKSNGVELEVEPMAMDGFVFITHKDNPVDSLTVQQIKDIYSGKITNWKEVGGRNEKIRAFQRTKNSGSQTAMEELVMEGEPMAEAPMTFVAEEMGELVERVAEYENESAAIGYTYYYYINNLYKNPDIKIINIDGVSPANENLLSGEYPFTTSYYTVIRSDEPEDSVYRRLRDYMLTDEGQKMISLAGYCSVTTP